METIGERWRTRAAEDFLRTVYTLQQATGPVSTAQISHSLHVTAPSVIELIRRLAISQPTAAHPHCWYPTQPLLEHMPYHGVRLTTAGAQIALQVIRRRRLLELYLVQRLDYSWDEVDVEADRLEHDLSEQLTERLAAALGNPEVDPHGEPIPTAQGNLPACTDNSLADMAVGQIGFINRIANHSPQLLQYLGDLGLHPGTEIRVVRRAPLGDTVTIQIGSASLSHVLSTQVASHLRLTAGMTTLSGQDNNPSANR